MLDFARAKFIRWDAQLPAGDLELLEHRYQLGELAITLFVNGSAIDERSAFELLARPDWFCVFYDERQQAALIGAVQQADCEVRMFEISDSPLVRALQQSEPLFHVGSETIRHWVLLGLDSCCHIVASEAPVFRRIF